MYQDALDATYKATLEKQAKILLEKKAFLPMLARGASAMWHGGRAAASQLGKNVAAGQGVGGVARGVFGSTSAGLTNIGQGIKGMFTPGMRQLGAGQLAQGMVQAAPAALVAGGALYGANRMGHAAGVQQEQNKPFYQRALGQ